MRDEGRAAAARSGGLAVTPPPQPPPTLNDEEVAGREKRTSQRGAPASRFGAAEAPRERALSPNQSRDEGPGER